MSKAQEERKRREGGAGGEESEGELGKSCCFAVILLTPMKPPLCPPSWSKKNDIRRAD